MRTALRRHRKGEARVIPIILRPVDWQRTPIGRLLAAPKDGKPVTTWHRRDDALLNVATSVRRAAEDLIGRRSSTQIPPNTQVSIPASSTVRASRRTNA
jgi:hypothetical protein